MIFLYFKAALYYQPNANKHLGIKFGPFGYHKAGPQADMQKWAPTRPRVAEISKQLQKFLQQMHKNGGFQQKQDIFYVYA